eukprot:gene358-6772_t
MEYLCFCFQSSPNNESGEYIRLKDDDRNKVLEEETIKMEMNLIFEDLQNLISKPFEISPTSKDLFRLYKKIKIMKENETLITPNETISLFQILNTLGNELQKEEEEKTNIENFEKLVNLNDFETLSTYCKKIYTDYNLLLQFLKLCNQSVVLIIARRLKIWFSMNNLYFKDVRGSWYIDIILNSESQKIIHKRKELCYKKLDGHFELFQFSWEIECTFSNLSKNLENIDFNVSIDEEKIINDDLDSRNWILNLFKIMKKRNEIKF